MQRNPSINIKFSFSGPKNKAANFGLTMVYKQHLFFILNFMNYLTKFSVLCRGRKEMLCGNRKGQALLVAFLALTISGNKVPELL